MNKFSNTESYIIGKSYTSKSLLLFRQNLTKRKQYNKIKLIEYDSANLNQLLVKDNYFL